MPTPRLYSALIALFVAASISSAFAADTIRSTSPASATVTVPYSGQSTPRVYARSASGKWQKAPAKLQDGRLIFQLDPAKLGSADITLLIDPPTGMVMDDYAGPAATALAVDRKAFPAGSEANLGNVTELPKRLVVTFNEAANILDPAGYSVRVDDRPVAVRPTWVNSPDPKQATLRVPLPKMDYGVHEVAISAVDTSPQANATTVRLRLNYMESGNVALAAQGATIKTDSAFSGYESLVSLNDGNTTMPGTSCGNDITWASAEVATDHWAEVTFPKPTEIKEVTVYWAAYTDVSHTPQHFEIQIPDGQGWKAVYKSPADGEQPARLTTARFAPVTTSKFRIFMPSAKGSSSRPNLLWIGEIKAR
jgi:hypothetical protein